MIILEARLLWRRNLSEGGTPLYGPFRFVRPQRVWFSAVSVIKSLSILTDFGHFGHKYGIVFVLWPLYEYVLKPRSHCFHHNRKEIIKSSSQIMFTRVQSSIDKSRAKAKIEREKSLGTRLGVSRIPNAYAGSN